MNLEKLHLGMHLILLALLTDLLAPAGANKIEYLPAEMFSALTQLKELYLYKNKINTIPAEIGNLQG